MSLSVVKTEDKLTKTTNIAAPAPVPAAVKTTPTSSKFGIQVKGGYAGDKPHIFTGTEHSSGPWNSVEEARDQIGDLREQLAYDDDFKHPTFTIVPVGDTK